MQRLHATLLDAWREAGRHLEIGDALAQVAPQLARRLPLDLVLVRRLDVARACLETLAAHACRGAPPPEAPRSELEPAELAAVLSWCSQGRVRHPRPPALGEAFPS